MRILSILCIVLATATHLAIAQDFPSRPVKLVVTFSAGGSNDIIARLLAPKLADLLKQSVIVENRPGGNNIPGADHVAKSAPDGYTLLMGNTTILGIMGSLFRNLPFDPQRDFAPVSTLAITSSVLVVHPSVEANNVKELVALANANPGKLNYASAGNGTPFHLSGELFKSRTGTNLIHVPYKGNAPAMIDLLAGRVQVQFANLTEVLAYIQNGKLRPIVWSGAKRTPLLPDVPTVAEAGFANAESVSSFSIVAPKGTPKDVVTRLSTEIGKVLRLPDVYQRMADLGLEPVGDSPEEADAFLRKEFAKWAKVIKDSGAKVDN